MKRYILPISTAIWVLCFALFCGYVYAGAWPTDNITTTNVDAATDDPSQARAEIYNAMLRVKDVIGAKGSASGVAPLDASALVPLANIPSTLTGKSADTLDGINSTSFARVDAASNFTTAPTISSNTVWHAGNDGAGSGLDADLLDGISSASFARVDAASNFTTAPTISSNTVWHAGNDGAGSGLDADLLGGYTSDTSTTANTIALRTSTGELYATQLRAAYSVDSIVFSGFNINQSNYTFLAYARDQTGYSNTTAAVYVGKASSTGRSINAGGTINASGADYAEYERKRDDCGAVDKGQIMGFDAHGMLTDRWALAVSFGVVSTDPSYVGGDTWGSEESLGMAAPQLPADAGTYARAQYAQQRAAFDAALEHARSRVEIIAYAGKVPVNVTGAEPGDYIVPLEAAGGGITGRAVPAAAVTFEEYRRAVGQVRRVLPDGRAEITVKVL